MNNNNTRSIEIIHKFIDLMIIQLAWWASYHIRFSSDLFPFNGSPLLLRYIKFSILLLIISYYFLSHYGLYNSKKITSIFDELYTVIKANALSFTLFKHLRKVLFPQPEGPINAVILNEEMLNVKPRRAWKSPYQKLNSFVFTT